MENRAMYNEGPNFRGAFLACVCGAVHCSVAHVHCRNRARGGGSVLCRCKMGTCNPTVPLWPAASPGSPPHIFLAAVMALGAVIFGRKDGSEVTAQQDRVLNVNRGCSIICQ